MFRFESIIPRQTVKIGTSMLCGLLVFSGSLFAQTNDPISKADLQRQAVLRMIAGKIAEKREFQNLAKTLVLDIESRLDVTRVKRTEIDERIVDAAITLKFDLEKLKQVGVEKESFGKMVLESLNITDPYVTCQLTRSENMSFCDYDGNLLQCSDFNAPCFSMKGSEWKDFESYLIKYKKK